MVDREMQTGGLKSMYFFKRGIKFKSYKEKIREDIY